jgi:hypothetical protein
MRIEKSQIPDVKRRRKDSAEVPPKAHMEKSHTAPRNVAFRRLLHETISANATLRDYFLECRTQDIRRNWVPIVGSCQHSKNCLCGHVTGDPAEVGSAQSQMCEKVIVENRTKVFRAAPCSNAELATRCECVTGGDRACLYGHMQPFKLLLVIAAARAANVTTIIEEGREGGVSALVYSMHGFDVVSIEYLPLEHVKRGLREFAPAVRQLDGDGSILVPQLIGQMSQHDAARTLVVFDGEKRQAAYKTYRTVQARIAAAVFDDTHVHSRHEGDFTKVVAASGEPFVDTAWSTLWHIKGAGLNAREREHMMLQQLDAWARTANESSLWAYESRTMRAAVGAEFIIVQSPAWDAARH